MQRSPPKSKMMERPRRTQISIESWTKPGQRFLQQQKQHILAVVVFQRKCAELWDSKGRGIPGRGGSHRLRLRRDCFLLSLIVRRMPGCFADRKRGYGAFSQEPTLSDLENEKSPFKDLLCQHCLVVHLKHGTYMYAVILLETRFMLLPLLVQFHKLAV